MADKGHMNLFEWIKAFGGCETFEPRDWGKVETQGRTPESHAEHFPTQAEPGSPEKIEILRRRVLASLPLWHPEDKQVEIDLYAGVRVMSANNIQETDY